MSKSRHKNQVQGYKGTEGKGGMKSDNLKDMGCFYGVMKNFETKENCWLHIINKQIPLNCLVNCVLCKFYFNKINFKKNYMYNLKL